MASTQQAYDFSIFEPYEYGTAAPSLEPDYTPDEQIRKKKKRNSRSASRTEKKATFISFVNAFKVCLCFSFIFSVICAVINLNVKLDETAADITSTESKIEIAVSENIKLSSALDGMVSIDKIEDYAENTLGMVKLENYKITYFTSQEDNHVVVSGGKSYNDSQITAKLKNLKEYIFGS